MILQQVTCTAANHVAQAGGTDVFVRADQLTDIPDDHIWMLKHSGSGFSVSPDPDDRFRLVSGSNSFIPGIVGICLKRHFRNTFFTENCYILRVETNTLFKYTQIIRSEQIRIKLIAVKFD